ncbi:MAG: sulfurtransferase TusA family protein [Methylohalobius sp. ZOD2]|uniref:sulfurtransferase TusA family protein n=1 Tax=Methylohalobius crimeensis TaxID=244365 RepID=UPI0003B75D70|nr:sulfurtransferase TusA family protein [Methylohalobius crimeensis]MBN2700088.1 sulfurtransferase TusA family protein [Methylothermaceae bacterium]
MSKETVDARGLLCPMPVIRLQDAAKDLPAGMEVELIGTDPGILNDVPAWCRINGHQIQDSWRQGDEYHVLLTVGE